MIFATGLHSCKKKFWILIQHFYFYIFLTYSEHIRKCSKLQIMMVFPVLIPVQNFLFPGTGRENLKCHGKGRDGKFEACIPGNHGKREFPLTPVAIIPLLVPNYSSFHGFVTYIENTFCKKMVWNGHFSSQQWSEQSTGAYRGSPPCAIFHNPDLSTLYC